MKHWRAYPTTANYSLAGALLQDFGLFAPSNTFCPKCCFSFLGKVGVFVPATLTARSLSINGCVCAAFAAPTKNTCVLCRVRLIKEFHRSEFFLQRISVPFIGDGFET